MLSKISVLLRLVVSIILLQSLYYKFSAHSEAVHIFSTLGAEPWGRLVLGGFELIIGIALLLPKTKIRALFCTVVLMIGALGAHLFTPLGIVVKWDGNSDNGQLFVMGLIALTFSIASIIIYSKTKKYSLPKLISKEIFKNNL